MTAMASLPASTLGDRLARRVAASPEADAYLERAGSGAQSAVCWREFLAKVQRTQRALAGQGLRRGDRLALIAAVSLEWEVIHHAALGMGLAVVGLDGHDLPTRLEAMLGKSGARCLITDQVALAQRLVAAQPGLLLVLLTPPQQPAVDGPLAARHLNQLREASTGLALPPPAEPADVATVIFTSGTTGEPKGIAFTHAQLGLAVDAICDAFPFVGPGGRLLCWLPLSNLFQRVVNLAAMNSGAATFLLPDPRQVMDAVALVEPEVFIGVPRFFDKLHDGITARVASLPPLQRALAKASWGIARSATARRLQGHAVPWYLALGQRLADALVLRRIRAVMGGRLRCLVSGSAPLSPRVLQDLEALGWPVLEAYGLSENVLPMSMNTLADRRAGTVGRPLPDNELVIGADGMVRVRGPGVFAGYLGEPPGTGLGPDGFFVTGDLGQLDADGYLRLTGRASELIKTSTGRRVAPAAIEAALRAAPGLDQAVVFGAGRKYLLAACTLQAAVPALGEERARFESQLREVVQGLSPHERPAGIAVLGEALSIDAGELTANLKLRRSAIEARHHRALDRLATELDRRGQTQHLLVRWPDDRAEPRRPG